MQHHADFTRMDNSSAQDWQLIGAEFMQFTQSLPQRVIKHLQLLEGDYGGFPVDRYTHSLQTATRALRDGRDEEYVCCALLHDIGDTLGSFNHPDIAAAILKPFVSEENLWMVQHHGIFQGHYFFHHIGMDRDMREQFRSHPQFERTAEFCALYDNPSFDAHAETFPLIEFEPMLQRLLARPKNSIYQSIVASDKPTTTKETP
ncbi:MULTISPECIES: HD domain-containing protein [unclassified Undibacterium]|uniref:HD domain-containing protein n=1 Tax=unclassified Undibacterium TaxID=2630295 RepID=UPI002AC9E679|nr:MULTISPECIES: HD domain-containing protein [unclassified Undibacterium]MEB0140470.1 HD domain-containing protein [Undibacterium sp. CCC2.1]MEB0173713.1 HD domain-containing protein [Undibacterium sp. CCC1.1]MEB0177713.1 HD domain-containing protein [Undibacterium sp. CCC3.4]MEB0217010.1 HD domain-containing protein [Undibacterium sp. 5I2]WPX44601.1 HD domain-containing protein [Undibacterium sp. CCC3.4]